MSFPDTTTVGPAFMFDECDWAKQVQLIQTWRTDISTGRLQGEQRATRMYQPKYSLSFSLSGLTPTEFAVRRAKSILEMGAPVVVPIWTARSPITSYATNSVVPNITAAPALRKYKINSYVFLVETGKVSTFRRITSFSGGTVNLHATDGYPPGFPTFTAAGFVYPCIFGQRAGNASDFSFERLDSTEEKIAIEEL